MNIKLNDKSSTELLDIIFNALTILTIEDLDEIMHIYKYAIKTQKDLNISHDYHLEIQIRKIQALIDIKKMHEEKL